MVVYVHANVSHVSPAEWSKYTLPSSAQRTLHVTKVDGSTVTHTTSVSPPSFEQQHAPCPVGGALPQKPAVSHVESGPPQLKSPCNRHAVSAKPAKHELSSLPQHAPVATGLPQKPGVAHVEPSPPKSPSDCTHPKRVTASSHVSSARQHAPTLLESVGIGTVGDGVGPLVGARLGGTGVGAGDGMGVGTREHTPVVCAHSDGAGKSRPAMPSHVTSSNEVVHENSGSTPN